MVRIVVGSQRPRACCAGLKVAMSSALILPENAPWRDWQVGPKVSLAMATASSSVSYVIIEIQAVRTDNHQSRRDGPLVHDRASGCWMMPFR
jgi:hypothetical protein